MTETSTATTWIRHVLGEPQIDGGQHCILCGVSVASHMLGHLPAGAVFEHNGRLFLIEPAEESISCLEQ